jgi:two-component system nitrate/nitrite response regulator NarL
VRGPSCQEYDACEIPHRIVHGWRYNRTDMPGYTPSMPQSGDRITVVVADDHPLYRTGMVEAIQARPDLELVAACAGGAEALERILALQPAAALLDLRMRDLDGLAVLEQLVRIRSRTRVIFLSAYEDGESVHGALTTGAAGYLTKETDRDEICDAIVAVVGGDIVVSPTLPGVLVGFLRGRIEQPQTRLGEREREVMRLTADGFTSAEIGTALGIAPTTVKTHLHRVYSKLEVSDRAAMVAAAFRQGLLT